MTATGSIRLPSHAWLVPFAAVVTIFRLWLASELGLAPDEAYYWRWSKALSLSYTDHPPMIAWMILAGTSIAGETALGVRLITVTVSCAGVAVSYLLAKASGLSRRHAATATAVASLLPAPAAGSILSTPDTAVAFCWLLALLALTRMSKSAGPRAWLVVGAALGVGLTAKHSALLIVPIAAISSALSVEIRRKTKISHLLSAFTLSLVIAAPYLIFEVARGFPSISFQLSHLTGLLDAPSSNFAARITGLAAGQIGLLTPLVAVWLIAVFAQAGKDRGQAILAAGYLVPLAASALAALFTHPEQNWASLGHPAAAIGAIGAIVRKYEATGPTHAKKRRSWIFAVAGTVVLLTALIHAHALKPFLPLPSERDPVSRLHGWERLQDLEIDALGRDAVVCGNYGLASELAWHTKNRAETTPIASLDRPPLPPPGSWLLLAENRKRGNAAFRKHCASVHWQSSNNLERRDGKKREP